MWNPDEYLHFREERSRPFVDLLARVECAAPETVVDLGCGTGDLTRTLCGKWRQARVIGVDSSAEMIARAQVEQGSADPLSFELGDLATWTAKSAIDVIVANASLHWVPDHPALMARLVGALSSRGVLAFQMPQNGGTPAQHALEKIRTSEKWSARFGSGAGTGEPRRAAALPVGSYVERLHELGMRVDAWETTYQHILQGDQPVLTWMKGTTLRPLLALLDTTHVTDFIEEYCNELQDLYPAGPWGTVFPFRRIFVVASR